MGHDRMKHAAMLAGKGTGVLKMFTRAMSTVEG